MAQLEIENLTISYRMARRKSRGDTTFTAVKDLNLTVEKGEFITIVGPSGCGKSSLLWTIDGLIRPEQGRVLINGQEITGPGSDRAVVFQEFALLPWLTVLANIEFSLELKYRKSKDNKSKAQHYLELVGLKGFEHYYPHQLSGGMRQRVGISRALAVEPAIILMDEPFGSLDAQTRELMGEELLGICELQEKTVIFITHGIDEAVYMADRVVVMGTRPGHVKDIVKIDLQRPRSVEMKDSATFGKYRRHIWNMLKGEADATIAET